MNKKVTKDFPIPRNDILNAILRQAQNDRKSVVKCEFEY